MIQQNPFADPEFGKDKVATAAAPAASATPAAPAPAPKANPFANPEFGKEPEGKGVLGHARDLGLSLAKGVIGVPEMAVGLGDMATGGRIGKFLENADGSTGFRPKEAKEFLSSLQTDQSKDQQRQFQQADGIIDKAGVVLSNPSMISNAVVESLPVMFAGGAIGRGALTAGRGMGAVAEANTTAQAARQAGAAGAFGEGVSMAGSQAEQIRQETKDGLLTPTQTGAAAATGLLGGAFSLGGARLARYLGIGDAETMMAQGAAGVNKQIADDAAAAAVNGLAKPTIKSIPRKIIEGAISEGFLEELPQSTAEQILQNLALDKPWHEGVSDAMVMGALTGGAMGAGAAGIHGYKEGAHAPGAAAAPAVAPAVAPAAVAAATTAEPLALPAPGITVGADGTAYTADDRNASTQREADQRGERMHRILSGEVTDVTPIRETPRPHEALGIDPNAGSLSAAAAIAVDSGASEQIAQASQAQAAAEAQAQAGKDGKKAGADEGTLRAAADLLTAPRVDADGVITSSDSTASPATYATYEDAHAYVMSQRRNGANVSALPVPAEGGGFRLALKGTPDYQQGVELRAQRAQVESAAQKAAKAEAPNDQATQQPTVDSTRIASEAARATAQVAAQDAGRAAADLPGIRPAQVEAAGVGVAASPANLKSITAKQIPAMTDVELQQAIQHYGPEHKRTAKLQKEVARRAADAPTATTTNGVTDGPQANQAQQASTQPAQAAGTQEAVAPAASVDAEGAAALAAVAPGSKSMPDTVARIARRKAVGEQWTRMPTAERQAVADKIDAAPVLKKNLHGAAWENLNTDVQRKLADVIAPQADVAAPTMAAAPVATAKPLKGSKVNAKAHAEAVAKRADHFAPGNIVQGYGGANDRVLSYTAPDAQGNWKVRVQEVEKKGGEWINKGQPREHSTIPNARELKAGPVERANTVTAQEASPRADAYKAPAIAVVSRFVAGDIDKGALMDRLVPLGMTEAQVASVTNRLGDGFSAADIRDVLARAQGAATTPATSTAPEHAQVGVDDRELGQIVSEFSAVHEAMGASDEKIHHLFDAPKKTDVVRLQEKVKVYNKEHGWMTPAEARERIAEWKERARAQGGRRSANADKIVLSLFDLTGSWSQPWEEAGYQVYRFDIQNDPTVGDVNNFSTGFFGDWFGDFEGQEIYAILAATPCTDFAVSGARHFAAKDKDGRTVASVKLVHQTLATIEHFRPAVWALENPVGRIEKLGGLPPWRLSFDPNHLGDPYTKKTLLWGRFNGELPIAPVEPTEGSKMHTQYGGKSLATKNARSATPEGFSYGFFLANNAIDNPQMAIANKFDRLDASLIGEAVKAGMTASEISTAVEDHYYIDLDDQAAEQALRDAIAERSTEAEPVAPAAPASTPEAASEAPAPLTVNAGGRATKEAITDFGEKIGGARKDKAQADAKPSRAKEKDERPAWARRFQIAQIATSSKPGEEGRWVIRDARSLDWTKQPKQVGASYATREEAEQAVPLAAVALKHRVVSVRHGDGAGYEIWRDVSDRKRVKVVDRAFDTREAALMYMAQNAQAIVETNTTFGESDLPRPQNTQRVGVNGAERRTGEVKDSDFIDTFGFRGVEFGNWNNQEDRQQLLDDAYDGLLDLADVIGIPAQAVSLNGELALAFGARGQGLSGARAHYEPGKAVINLTKMNGAGSLAHEWFHALDHYFGRQDGKASAEWVVDKDGTRSLKANSRFEGDAVSSGFSRANSGVREAVRDAYSGLMKTIATKAEQYVEDTAKADRFVATSRDEVAKRVASMRAELAAQKDVRYYKRNNKPASAEQLAEFDAVAQGIVDGTALETDLRSSGTKSRSPYGGMRWTNDALEKISAIRKAVRGNSGFSADQTGELDRLRGDMGRYSQRMKMLADAQGGEGKTKQVPTEFAMNAKELDQGRGGDYWTTPHEMAARAFQGYVEDKIAEGEGRSPFLNYGPENAVIITPWGLKRPYPHGAERVAINSAFDKLVNVIETRAEDNGNVALFSRAPEAGFSAAARAQAIAAVEKTATSIRSAWANGPEVVVAYDMGDPVVPASARRADLKQRSGGARGAPEGFYYRGKVYLMASRLNTPADAARVLFHEALGHHGLRGAFGGQLDGILNQIGTMRRAEVDAKIREYGLRGVNRLDRRAAAEEVLAEMAQTTPDISFVRRAVAAIRTWLRQNVPGFRNMAVTNDEIIRSYILPARRFVEDGGPGGGGLRGDALFSRGAQALRPATNFLQARVAASQFQGKPLTNDATGMVATVSRNSLDKMLSGKAVGKSESPATHSLAVANVDQLFAQAHLGWSKPDVGGDKNIVAIHRFFAPLTVDGRTLMTKMTVKETAIPADPNRLYTVEAVDFNEESPAAQWVAASAAADGISLTSIRSAGEALSLAEQIERHNAGADDAEAGQLGESGESPMFSRSKIAEYTSKATAELNKTLNAPGRLSWWHKTIGTMHNLAEQSPAFKPVFDAAQGFVDDVSFYATDASELAPRLLPKLDEWRDIKKRPVSAADNTAVAKPVFEGTLTWARDDAGKPVKLADLEAEAEKMTAEDKAQRLLRRGEIDAGMLKAWQGMPVDSYERAVNSRYASRILSAGVVWSDAELQSEFGLRPEQIALYREFRQATDRSLDTMARADMLRFAGDDLKGIKDAVMDAPDVAAATTLIAQYLRELQREQPGRAGQIADTMQGIVTRADKVKELQDKGYAPLSRFGQYTVDVTDAEGQRQYFSLFETKREANAMAEQMRAVFPDAGVDQGTLSNEAFKMFAGITPESLELFGNMLGLDSEGSNAQDQAFQEYLKLTKTNRSAMRRLIHRKGIAGYSEDVGRVLASFIYSNARQTAAGLHMGDLGDAVGAIPKAQGELKDAAVRLAEYVKNPQEEAQAVRGLLFAQYLGGSLASAFVNMTQPVAVTFPWLSQYGGAVKAASALTKAAKDMATKGHPYEADLAKALKAAEDDGTVSPQEVHQLMAQSRGSGSLRSGDGTKMGTVRAEAGNAMTVLSMAWGKVFGAAEQVNRRVTFIAAYRMARDRNMSNPFAFAKNAVRETQFLYSKANKMQWGRGAIGGTLMTFKTYSVAYIELMHRMWTQGGPEGKKAAALALATLMLMGGAGGLPFMEDAEDVATGLAQLMGYNLNARQAKQEFLEGVFGKALADFIDKGVTGLPGMPVDVSGRLGMGNLIPGTGLLQEKTSHTRDVLEIAGPMGDFASRILSGGRRVLGGDIGAGALEMMPAAVRNAAKGADMAATGMYRDSKGYKVLETTHLEAALKAIGFQPATVANVQEANGINQAAKNFYNFKAQEIRSMWARGIFEEDAGEVQTARDAIATWNRKNPDQPMLITVPSVMHKVREMRKPKDQRIADTAPKAMRAKMREDLHRPAL